MPRTKHPCQFGLVAIATLLLLEAATTAFGQPGKQPPSKPAPTPRAESLESLLGGPEESAPSDRLAGTPNMFGDRLDSRNAFMASGFPSFVTGSLPLAGGCRRVKIADDDNALPQDRVFFTYNHFENALQAEADTIRQPPTLRSFAIDRYTFGCEKTFFDRRWSAELRMPLCSQMALTTPGAGISGGQVGNLALIVKRKVYESCSTVVAIGLGIDTPTGSDAQGFANATQFTVHNESVHLAPFIGLVNRPSDRLFWEGFIQVDVPTSGDNISFVSTGIPASSGTFGTLNDQPLLYADLGVGYWLQRNPCATFFTGVASVIELHYTTTLQDAGIVSGSTPDTFLSFGNFANRFDELNLTVGLHTEILNRTICRVGGVFPLRTGADRSFDAEVQVQLERRF